MTETLAYLDERHGGPERFLLSAGASSETIARLRERLLGPQP